MDIKIIFCVFFFLIIMVYYLSVNNEDQFYVNTGGLGRLTGVANISILEQEDGADVEDVEEEDIKPIIKNIKNKILSGLSTDNVNRILSNINLDNTSEATDSEMEDSEIDNSEIEDSNGLAEDLNDDDDDEDEIESEEEQVQIDKNALYVIKNVGGQFALTMPEKVDKIKVKEASYGSNCGAPKGNVTAHLAKLCNDRSTCQYIIDHRLIGNPASACPKKYKAVYSCGDKNREISAPAEASGQSVQLSCDRSVIMANTKFLNCNVHNRKCVFRFVSKGQGTYSIETADGKGRLTILGKKVEGVEDRYPIFIKQKVSKKSKNEFDLFKLVKNLNDTISIVSADGKGILSFWDSKIWTTLPTIYNVDQLAVCMYTGSECEYQNCEFTLTKMELINIPDLDDDLEDDEIQVEERPKCNTPWADYTVKNGVVTRKKIL